MKARLKFESPFDTLSDQVQMRQDLENSGTWREYVTKNYQPVINRLLMCIWTYTCTVDVISNFIVFLHMYYG